MKTYSLMFALLIAGVCRLPAQEIIIQENEIGFCSVDGVIATSVGGYTGSGYADTDLGVGKSISWEITAPVDGRYALVWRYAVDGNPGDRNARLLINGNLARDTVHFPHTGTWTNWTMSADTVWLDLAPGDFKIRIEAYATSGLGNFDYLKVIGPGVTPAACTPSYVVSVAASNPACGTVSYSPVQAYYDRGTLVTMRAQANTGYFFQSWTGEATSADTAYTFPIQSNVAAVARFLPDGTTGDPAAVGYATIQDDRGTPYMVIGGGLGDTVDASTVADLQTYLGSPNPYVVRFTGELVGTETISVTSDKTLLGVGDTAHLNGIELSINQARNVIIRNMTISHVTPQDAMEINGKSKNILIDHCQFFSDRDHGTDFYDGLLDIKNESSFITVSWSSYHDHYKVCLMSSGDTQFADTVIRATFHHNYFYNCESRLPSLRFGKVHVFNNYYRNCHTAINSRMGAWVRVERNYFDGVGTAVMMEYSPISGAVQLIDNHFGTSGVTSEPTCDLQVPYPYLQVLDPTESLPGIITGNIEVGTAVAARNGGWNLVSVPLAVANDSPYVVFPRAIPSTIYGYLSGTYERPLSLSNGQGYWAFYSGAGSDSISGYPITNASVVLGTGGRWVLIGSVTNPVPVANLVSNPPGMIVPGSCYYYDGSKYVGPATLDPGNGYWVFINAPCTLSISQ